MPPPHTHTHHHHHPPPNKKTLNTRTVDICILPPNNAGKVVDQLAQPFHQFHMILHSTHCCRVQACEAAKKQKRHKSAARVRARNLSSDGKQDGAYERRTLFAEFCACLAALRFLSALRLPPRLARGTRLPPEHFCVPPPCGWVPDAVTTRLTTH